MKPTKMLPYVVLLDDGKSQVTYTFRTERQAKKFAEGVQVGTHFKVAMYVSIKKGKRGGAK